MKLGTPRSWNLPEKFTHFREFQTDSITRTLNSPARFIGKQAPCGFGKTLDYVATHQIERASQGDDYRTCIVVHQKSLQDQILREFSDTGIADVRGANSYACKLDPKHLTCEDGASMRCEYARMGGCPRKAAVAKACAASLVVTNYHFWIAANEYGEGIGRFDQLILDEAPLAEGVLTDHLSVWVKRRDNYPFPDDVQDRRQWRDWANLELIPMERDIARITARAETNSASENDLRRLTKLKRRIQQYQRLRSLDANWVIDESREWYVFSPVDVGEFAHSLLYRGVPRVQLYSATLVPMTLELLGVDADSDDCEFMEFESSFPAESSPVYYVPTCAVKHTMSEGEERVWLSRIRLISDMHDESKGLIHAISYARAKAILDHLSGNGRVVRMHGRDDLSLAIRLHRESRDPAILLSPVITHGYDFPFTDAEWQVIAKLAFPDTRGRENLYKARNKRWPNYTLYTVLQDLQQQCGRVMRDGKDRGSSWIVDNQFAWVYGKGRKAGLVTGWFKRLVRTVDGAMPEPLEKL